MLEGFLTCSGSIATCVMLFVLLHALPNWRIKDYLLEWAGWGTAVVAATYVLLPFKLIDPRVPVVGHLDNVAAVLIAGFGVMTATAARCARKVEVPPCKESEVAVA
jgi:hypothetical protein